MAKGDICKVDGCSVIVKDFGKVCNTHRWYKKRYGSYEKPIELTPTKRNPKCIKHGELNPEDFRYYTSSDRDSLRYMCKLCQKERDQKRRDTLKQMKFDKKLNDPSKVNKTCYIHGELFAKDIYLDSKGSYGCKICKRDSKQISDRKWALKSKTQIRNSNLKKTYGITLLDYEQILISQNNVCLICKQPETLSRRGLVPPLAVDHCHKAESQGIMKIRGLLCKKCNSAIALLKDNPEIMRAAADYIEKHQQLVDNK